MTTATGSPTWRTRSTASTGCGGSFIGEPSLELISQPPGRALNPAKLAGGRPPDIVGRHILAGEHGDNPGRRCRAAGVKPSDPGMRVRAAQDIGVELARPVDVVGVSPLSGQEAVILLAPNRLSDGSVSHGRYSAATPWGLAGGVSSRITAAPSAIASTML